MDVEGHREGVFKLKSNKKSFFFKDWKGLIIYSAVFSVVYPLLSFILKRYYNYYKLEMNVVHMLYATDIALCALGVCSLLIIYCINYRMLQRKNPSYGKRRFWVGFSPVLVFSAVEVWIVFFYKGY